MDNKQAQEFVFNTRQNFDKYSELLIKADEHLAKGEFKQFEDCYEDLSITQLRELVKGQHLRCNEIYDAMKKRSDTLMSVFQDIANCKDFVAFGDLKKRAISILLANNMVQHGKDPDEVRAMMKAKAEQDTKATSNIIVQ